MIPADLIHVNQGLHRLPLRAPELELLARLQKMVLHKPPLEQSLRDRARAFVILLTPSAYHALDLLIQLDHRRLSFNAQTRMSAPLQDFFFSSRGAGILACAFCAFRALFIYIPSYCNPSLTSPAFTGLFKRYCTLTSKSSWSRTIRS